MNEQNLTTYNSINNQKSCADVAYLCAVEHVTWAIWQGMTPLDIITSVGVLAPVDANWNRALGVIWSKSMEFEV